jgi:Xaa-Pro dipeptidase
MLKQGRLARVIENMEKEHLKQIIVTSKESIYYLTGIWVDPFERMLALYIQGSGRVVLFGNELFCIKPDANIEMVIRKDGMNPLTDLAEMIEPGKIGIDKTWESRYLIGLLDIRRDITPVNGSAAVDFARLQKDEEEIEIMRNASRINDMVMQGAVGMIHEGVMENEISGQVEKLFAKQGGDHSPEGQIVSFGANAANPHHEPNSTVIQDGDGIVLDIFNPIKRYWCDMTRTVYFRHVSDEQQLAYEAVKRANLAAEAMIRPGLPMCEFDRAARKVLEDAGFGKYFTHRLGHGCGLECHEMPENSSSNEMIARPGMVFSVEPGAYLPGRFGVRIEDLVVVTDTGCEVLNSFTKEITVIR